MTRVSVMRESSNDAKEREPMRGEVARYGDRSGQRPMACNATGGLRLGGNVMERARGGQEPPRR